MSMRALPLERTPQPGVLRARGIALIRSREATVVAFIVVLGMFLEAVTGRFLASTNLANVLLNSAGTAIVALGMTLVILTGGIDVSVGSMLGVGAGAVGDASAAGGGLGPLVLGGLAGGGVLGLVNGGVVGFGGCLCLLAPPGTS